MAQRLAQRVRERRGRREEGRKIEEGRIKDDRRERGHKMFV